MVSLLREVLLPEPLILQPACRDSWYENHIPDTSCVTLDKGIHLTES